MQKVLTISFVIFIMPSLLWASEVILISGQKIEGKITEQTDKYIKIDSGIGQAITYYTDEINTIDGQKFHVLASSTPAASQSDNFETRLYKVLLESGLDDQTSKALASKLLPLGNLFSFNNVSNPEEVREALIKSKDAVRSFLFPNDQITQESLDILTLFLGEPWASATRSFYNGRIINLDSSQGLAFDCNFFTLICEIVLKAKGLNLKGVQTRDIATLAYLYASPQDRLLFEKGVPLKLPFQKIYNLKPSHAVDFINFNDGRFVFADFLNGNISDLYPFADAYTQIIGKNYIRSQDRKELYKDIDLVEINELRACLYDNMALIFKNNDLTQALSNYNKAIEVSPNFPIVYINRGLYYEGQGALDQAIEDYTKSIEINPDIAYAYDNRGNVYFKQNNFTQAMSDYNKAIELDPDYAEAYSNRGTIYENGDKNYVQALSDFNKAVEADPYYVEVYYNRAIIYYELAKYDQAWDDIHKAEELGFTNIDPALINALKQATGRDK